MIDFNTAKEFEIFQNSNAPELQPNKKVAGFVQWKRRKLYEYNQFLGTSENFGMFFLKWLKENPR